MIQFDAGYRDSGPQASRVSRIAVVDDDASVRTAISRFLTIANFKVDLYARSIDFIDSLDRQRPDCLILDLHMPTLTGIDVMEYLKASNIEFATVIVSADDEPNVREICSNLGAVGFLRKPLDGDHLLQVIETVQQKPHRDGTAAKSAILGIWLTHGSNGRD